MENIQTNERELFAFFKDTSELAAAVQSDSLSTMANVASSVPATQMAGTLVNKVEYWKWMGRNFHCLGSPDLIAKRAEIGGSATDWLHKQVQGKGYEWDYFNKLRSDPRNIFSHVELPDIPNQPGHDMAKIDINGKVAKYQNKAYTSNNPLDLSNATKDTVIVTNEEHVSEAAEKGFRVEKYKTGNEIKTDTDKRMSEARSSKTGRYTFGNVAGVMLKAGAIGFTVSAGIEAIVQYRRYKNGEINGVDYLQTIALAGGHRGVLAAATAGLMMSIQVAITTAGLASPIAIPIGFVVGIGIDKLVAPMFGRGDYAVLIAKAKYYNNLNQFYGDLEKACENANESFRVFVLNSIKQNEAFSILQQHDMESMDKLTELYNKI